MKTRPTSLTTVFFLIMLVISFVALATCSSPSSTGNTIIQSQPKAGLLANNESTPSPSETTQPGKEVSQPATSTIPVSIVIAGYINHGPMQPTVRAIKEVLAKYGDKLTVTWVDLNTTEGQRYFQQHGLTAHMNIIINGTSRYRVKGKDVDFVWFEGQQWTKEDLDVVLTSLVR